MYHVDLVIVIQSPNQVLWEILHIFKRLVLSSQLFFLSTPFIL